MINRRNFIKLGAVGGGAVFLSGLRGFALASDGTRPAVAEYGDFYFVQLSDTQLGLYRSRQS